MSSITETSPLPSASVTSKISSNVLVHIFFLSFLSVEEVEGVRDLVAGVVEVEVEKEVGKVAEVVAEDHHPVEKMEKVVKETKVRLKKEVLRKQKKRRHQIH